MNDSELRNGSENKNVYHATTNLNTAIENPQINMNSATGVNIQEIEESNYGNFNNGDINQVNISDNYDVSQNMTNSDYNVDQSNATFNNEQFVDNSFENNQNSDNSFINYQSDNNSVENNSSQFIPTGNDIIYESSESKNVGTYANETVYRPTLNEKKKPVLSFKVTGEFKVVLFIAFILFIAILVIPYIYDFFWGLY